MLQKSQLTSLTERTDAEHTLVSVVIPAYNAAKYIADTMFSVLSQQAVELELIIVDDCSTDDTAAIVRSVAAKDKRVRYLSMPSNSGGPAGPRNIGVQAATSQWVAFCDADDLWYPYKLRKQIDIAQREGADLVCSAIEDFLDGTSPHLPQQLMKKALPVSKLPYWQMLLKDRIATSSALCRREVLLQSGGFNTARELIAVEDYDLWLRLMERKAFKVLRIEVPLVAYRRLPQSLSANKLRHARKVMRVPRMAAERGGWIWAFPFLLPLIFVGYGLMSVYWRLFRGRL